MSSFHLFADAVRAQFNAMTAQPSLFVTDVSKDDMKAAYLASFPEGTNLIYKERTEHDCQSCFQFIKEIGNVVAIINGQLVSVWDVTTFHPYQDVANAMSALVKSKPIRTLFLSREAAISKPITTQLTDFGPIEWHHLSAIVPPKFVNYDRAEHLSSVNSSVHVFKRGLDELTTEALSTVLELIDQNSLYRGQEFRPAVSAFLTLKRQYDATDSKSLFIWSNYTNPAIRIRNTAIGTLLQDLSEGKDLEASVRAFESVVAPSNYKRPTALITPGMIAKATELIESLGIEPSLHRRHARITDISVNNVLFADRSVAPVMQDSIAALLATSVKPKAQNFDTVEEISISDFISKVLPTCTSIEAYVSNAHKPNFMSLIAPVYQSAPPILKWNNNFSLSYNGNVADSMKERVKAKGGKVDGVLRFSIQWNDNDDNHNDLDAHCRLPNNSTIYFANKYDSVTLGELDVDIIRPKGIAVENITFPSESKLKEGSYDFFVNNYSGTTGHNFSAEIEFKGKVYSFRYTGRCSGRVHVATVHYCPFKGFSITPVMPLASSASPSTTIYNVSTETFVPVSLVLYSPNFWDDQAIGNQHYLFILKDCRTDEPVNGFYNEFLSNELTPHRKVFEVLSSKLRCPPSDQQVSGLGFSSTQRNELIVKVQGTFTRTLKIKF